jgi:hypothetical protein
MNFLWLTGGVVSKKLYICLKLTKNKQNMKGKIVEALIGAGGIVSIEAVESVSSLTPEYVSTGVQIISQIVILIVTLIGLFRKNKVAKNQNQ